MTFNSKLQRIIYKRRLKQCNSWDRKFHTNRKKERRNREREIARAVRKGGEFRGITELFEFYSRQKAKKVSRKSIINGNYCPRL